MSQLERDIENQVKRKLRNFIIDSLNLYEIAGIDRRDALSFLTAELIYISTMIIREFAPTLSPEEYGHMCAKALYVRKTEEKGS